MSGEIGLKFWCSNCNFKSTDFISFQNHLSSCKKSEEKVIKQEPLETKENKEENSEQITCQICF